MHNNQRFLTICFCFTLLFSFWLGTSFAAPVQGKPPITDKITTILTKITPKVKKELTGKGFQLGAPLFIRIFKLSAELEVWIEKNDRFVLFKTYPICDFSGYPGPKRHEGDWQSPEGFYSVSADQMNPRSNYHLSFNIGYPNEYDKHLNRSGSNIMVHGNCSSMGCFAMNDYRMEEIYTLAHLALTQGQGSIAIHIFPFRMTTDNMKKFESSPWIVFWRNLKEGFDAFERTGQVPEIRVTGSKYEVTDAVRLAMRMRGSKQMSITPLPATPQNHQYK